LFHRIPVGASDDRLRDRAQLRSEQSVRKSLAITDDKNVAIYVADIHYLKDCFVLRSDLLKAVASASTP
jgi:GntR family transcriptional regulator